MAAPRPRLASLIRRVEVYVQGKDERLSEVFDGDHDGYVDRAEIHQHISILQIRSDLLANVLELEEQLAEMLAKLPLFALNLSMFIGAIMILSPPLSSYNVHRHLDTHFALGGVKDISNLKSLYAFMDTFEKKNMEFQATSAEYWCESRYAQYIWNERLQVPEYKCPSPRQYALSLTPDETLKWTTNTSKGGGNDTACQDNTTTLRNKLGNVTCAEAARDPVHAICAQRLGVEICQKTCGFCSPWTYVHQKYFRHTQVSMLPSMVFQERLINRSCSGFGEEYDHQPYNDKLTMLPALDGERLGRVLDCVDHNSHMTRDYAIYKKCPEEIENSTQCKNGFVRITQQHKYDGRVIYPWMLAERLKDIPAMKKIQWIDRQTERVIQSTLIYTEDIEMFTLLTVSFTFDEAGNIDGRYDMNSYRDLTGGIRSLFITFVCCNIVIAMWGCLVALRFMGKKSVKGRKRKAVYELISRSTLMIYCIVLLITWKEQIPMKFEYRDLLYTFLGVRDSSEQELEIAVQRYFDVKTHIDREILWLSAMNAVAYIVCYIQFLQLIIYFNAHPRMAVVSDTIKRAAGHLSHFLALFLFLFTMLGFMGHWMLGTRLKEFGTFGETVKSQLRMMYGTFIQAERTSELSEFLTVMYWIYAGTFMLIVWIILLNFVLAIVVDAFIEVKASHGTQVCRDFLSDCIGSLRTIYLRRKHQWPRYEKMHKYLKCTIKPAQTSDIKSWAMRTRKGDAKLATKIPPGWIQEEFHELSSDEALADFLHYYYGKCPLILEVEETEADHNRDGISV